MALLQIEDAEVSRSPGKGEMAFRLTIGDFAVAPGDRVGLVGPSGSGKSTLLELIALLLWPDRVGRFSVAAEDAAPLLKARDMDGLARLRSRHMAYAPQNGGLLPYLSVLENARIAARMAGRYSQAREAEIHDHAARLGIRALLQKKPAALSGGERHRAALLRMAAIGAPLIIADEPTAALDKQTATGVIAQLTETAAAAGAALVCASHDVPLIERYGFRILQVTVDEDPGGALRHAHLAAA